MMEHLKDAKLDKDALSAVAGGAGVAETSGTFKSDSGTKLDIIVNWSVSENAGSKLLHVDVSTTSYSLNYTSMSNAVELEINGEKYAADSNTISYNSKTTMATLPLASFDRPVYGSSAYLVVTWNFNGEYSGQQINKIVATRMLNI